MNIPVSHIFNLLEDLKKILRLIWMKIKIKIIEVKFLWISRIIHP